MRKLFALVLAAAAMSGAFADCYTMTDPWGNATLGRETHIDSTDRFIIYCGTVNIAEGSFVRSGGNDNGACNFIGVDAGAPGVLNINGGTFWCASANGAGVLGVGNNDLGVTSTVNINSGELIVDSMLRMSTTWYGTDGVTSSGTVNVNGGTATVKEFFIGANGRSNTGTAVLNLAGGITRTQRITFPAYNGQVFYFNGGTLEAQAANIFNLVDYDGLMTRTLEVVNNRTSIFRTGGFDQTIPGMTGTGYLRLAGGGTVTFAQKELSYGLILDDVVVDLGLLDADNPALSADNKVDFRSPPTFKVTLPGNPSGKYPLIANCETITAAGVIANATVIGGGAGKLIYQDHTIYLDFGNESSEGLVLFDPAGGAFTPDASSYTSLIFENTAGEYTLGGTGLTFTYGIADGAPGRQTVTAPISITTANETIFVKEDATLDLAGGLTVTGSIVKDGKGTLALSHETRPNNIQMREGILDFGGGTFTGTLDCMPAYLGINTIRAGGSEVAFTNGVYRPAAETHVYYPEHTLRILDGFTLDLRANDGSRVAVGYLGTGNPGINQTDKISKLIIDGGTFYTAGDQAGHSNFINPDFSGTSELIVNRGAFYATTANGGTLRIAIGNNRNTIGYLRINGGHFQLDHDLTLATQYNGWETGSGRAFFEQTGGVAQISYFYLGASNSGIGEGTVTLTGGELKVRMLKCWQYNKQTLLCDGAKITALQNDADDAPFLTQLGNGDSYERSYTIGANGLELNTAGFTVRDDLPFAGVGGMSVTGEGTLNLNCVHTFHGAFTVGAGTTVNLKRMRTFRSNITLDENARLQVAASEDEATTVLGALTLGAGAKLVFDLEAAGCASSTFIADGGFMLPEGATDVLDFVDVTDATKYEAFVNGNEILVRIKDLTVPTEAIWTGAGEAGNLADSDNWACRNVVGEDLPDAIPTEATTIRISGATTFSVPANAVFPHKRIVFGNVEHRSVQWFRRSAGSMDPNWTTLAITDYDIKGDGDIANLNGFNTPWQDANLGSAQLRFEGWVFVPAAKAGTWSIQQYFDDYYAFYLDGAQILANPFWNSPMSATCEVPEGWHRFTIICGDNNGGKGGELEFNGGMVSMAITCNGSSFILTDLTVGTDANTITLGADCDWRGLGPLTLNNAPVIDLNGHNLALGPVVHDDGLGIRFVNTDANHLATLTFDIPEGVTFDNTGVSVEGNIHLVKAGTGEFYAVQSGQQNAGLTIAAGKATAGQLGVRHVLGAPDTEIWVDSGSLLEMNGKYDHHEYTFVMNGGTMKNSVGIGESWGKALIKSVRVEKDSFLDFTTYGFIGNSYSDTTLDLQGHTLDVTMGGDFSYFVNTSVTAGTLILRGGFEFNNFGVTSGVHGGTFYAPDTRIEMHASFNPACEMHFGDYIDFNPGEGPYSGQYAAPLYVHGTFQPNTDYFYGAVMMDGSTLDLHEKTEPWDPQSQYSIRTSQTNVTFMADATITVDLNGRGIHSGEKIIAWTEAPDAHFVPDPASKAAGRSFIMKDDGLYVLSGMMIYIR